MTALVMTIAMLDKSNFPIFQNYKTKFGKDLIYLDNAATTQKLDSVIQKMFGYYLNYCSNVHRGIYNISELATEEFELSRSEIAKFFNVKKEQIIFTSGTTDSLNIIARSCKNFDIEQIVTTELEHNSNLLPFNSSQLCRVSSKEKRDILQIAKINDNLSLNYENIQNLIQNKKSLLTITGCSNVTGEIVDFTEINKLLNLSSFGHLPKRKDVILSLDAAQLIPHILFDPEFDIENLKSFDFVSFSGHKVFGPTGIGVLIANNLDLIDKLEANIGGGTIESLDLVVKSEKNNLYEETFGNSELEIIYKNSPDKFEAGTQNIAGVIGLGEVFRMINSLKTNERLEIKNANQVLAKYTFEKLSEIPELKMLSNWNLQTHAPIFAFNIKNIHPHDVAQYLSDEANICVRAGQHCTHLLHKSGNINASIRTSLSIYNTKEEIDKLVLTLKFLIKEYLNP